MSLTKKQIQDSGLLELYVLAELAPDEMRTVAAAIEQFPELRDECRQIETAYKYYADAYAVQPRKELIDNIIQDISKSNPNIKGTELKGTAETYGKKGGFNFWIPLFLGALAFSLWSGWNISKQNKERESLEERVRICDEQQKAKEVRYAIYDQLNSKNNRIVEIAATEKYPQTQLYLHTNATDGKNYIQIQNLPSITANQSYQLWSLKGDNPPVPMDVFQGEGNKIFEVGFVPDTDAYAITIEARGGKDAPDLTNLIGVISISG